MNALFGAVVVVVFAAIACCCDGILLHSNAELCEISPDSSRAACIIGNWRGIDVVQMDGSQAPISLVVDSDLPVGGQITSIRWTSNDVWIVFHGDAETGSRPELFSVPADGSSAHQRLNGDLAGLGAEVHDDFALSPDGSTLVYLADQNTLGQAEVYAVPVDGSASSVRLNRAPMTPSGEARGPPVATNTLAVFIASEPSAGGNRRLWSAPLDGSSLATDLSPSLIGLSEVVTAFSVSPDRSWVASASDDGMVVAPIAGGSETVLHATAEGDTIYWTSDGSVIVWCGDGSATQIHQVWAAPANGSSPAVRQSQAGNFNQRASHCAVSPDDSWVGWIADFDTDDVFELWSAPLTLGSTPTPTKLNGPMNADGDVFSFLITLDSPPLVLYVADQEAAGVNSIYIVGIDGTNPSWQRMDPTFLRGCQTWVLSNALPQWLLCHVVGFAQKPLYRATTIPGTLEEISTIVTNYDMAPDSLGAIYVQTNDEAHSLDSSSISPSSGASSSRTPPNLWWRWL